MLAHFGIDEFATMRLQAAQCAYLVSPHQPRIPGDIDREDRGKAAMNTIPFRASPVSVSNIPRRPQPAEYALQIRTLATTGR